MKWLKPIRVNPIRFRYLVVRYKATGLDTKQRITSSESMTVHKGRKKNKP